MTKPYDLILKGGTIVTHTSQYCADIGIRNKKIATIVEKLDAPSTLSLNCKGLHVLPGIIDTHVHLREPGDARQETLKSGSIAAVRGGVTTVCDMPNTAVPLVDLAALNDKLERATNGMACNFGFWVGATTSNLDSLPELEAYPFVIGIKVFYGSSTGQLLLNDLESLSHLLNNARKRVSFHAEEERLLDARKTLRVPNDPASHSIWRSPEVARSAVETLVNLAERLQRPIHILHVSTDDELSYLAKHRRWVSVEATPHHLTLDAPTTYRKWGNFALVNPPLRTQQQIDALWIALRNGFVDVLGSDHAPHTIEKKSRPYPESPSGFPGLQTLLPIMLTHVAKGKLSLNHLVQLTSFMPQKLFNIDHKGQLDLGYDADLTIVDLQSERTIDTEWLSSICGWSLYSGFAAKGWPVGTIVMGQIAMWEGKLYSDLSGQPIQIKTTP